MSVTRYDPEDWGGLHMAAKEKGDWVCYEEWEKLEAENAALKEENERLKATNTLDFEARLAKFQEEVWRAAANEGNKTDYDMAGIDTAKELISMYSRLKKDNEVFESCRLVNELLYRQIDTLKARVAELKAVALSDDLKLVLSNYKNSTLVPRHYRICEYIISSIAKL